MPIPEYVRSIRWGIPTPSSPPYQPTVASRGKLHYLIAKAHSNSYGGDRERKNTTMTLEVIYLTRHGVTTHPHLSTPPKTYKSPTVPLQLGSRPQNWHLQRLHPLSHRNPLRPRARWLRRHPIPRTRRAPLNPLPAHRAFLL